MQPCIQQQYLTPGKGNRMERTKKSALFTQHSHGKWSNYWDQVYIHINDDLPKYHDNLHCALLHFILIDYCSLLYHLLYLHKHFEQLQSLKSTFTNHATFRDFPLPNPPLFCLSADTANISGRKFRHCRRDNVYEEPWLAGRIRPRVSALAAALKQVGHVDGTPVLQ